MIKTKAGEVVGTRVYTFRDLRAAGVPFSRKHIRTLELRNEFPRHFYLGANSIGWEASLVDAWVEGRIRNHRYAPAA